MIERSFEHSIYRKWVESLWDNHFFYGGISLWNSYYTNSENLKKLFSTLNDNNLDVRFTFFEWPHQHTLHASWKDDYSAEKETKKRLRYHQNVILRTVLNNSYTNIQSLEWITKNWFINSDNSISVNENDKSKLFINWMAEIANQIPYIEALKKINALYNSNEIFRRDVQDEYLSISSSNILKIDEWVKYLLKEFAYIISASKLSWSQLWILIYHKPRPILESLTEWKYWESFENIWMLVVR